MTSGDEPPIAPRSKSEPSVPVRPAPRRLELERGDPVLVTGAAGFIGSAIVRALIPLGVRVIATVEPHGRRANLSGLDVEVLPLDIRRRSEVFDAMKGVRAVFHTAAVFRFWAPDPSVFYDVNVHGTRNVLDAAAAANCERVVYTSTVATIGLDGTDAGQPANETVPNRIHALHGLYKQSKYVAEHEVLRAAAEGAPVSLVHPTFPLGPRDLRPTPTGKVILDFLNGKMPAYVDTAMNVVHVDDLAQGHLLVLERGQNGRSYILGGENLSMRDLLHIAAERTGLPAPRRQLPRVVGIAAGFVSEMLQGRLLRREPRVPLEAARMSATRMIFDSSRARTELGFTTRPAVQAIEDSARWFVENGYVHPRRASRIRWAS